MVNVPSSRGGFVNVQVKGIGEALRVIREKGQDIVNDKDAKTLQASNMLQQEIQESIIGNRLEEKSVDTGEFANSITVNKIKPLVYSISSDVPQAQYMEYGTIYIMPRMHFRHSLARNKQKIIDIIKSKFIV